MTGSSQQSLEDKKDFSEEAKMLFETIEFTGGNFGLAVPIYILRGSSNQRVTEQMKRCASYSKGKHISDNWWKAFGRMLMCEKYLQEKRIQSFGKNSNFGSTVNITSKAKVWLEKVKRSSEKNESIPLILELSAELVNLEESKAAATIKKTVAAPVPVKKILSIPALHSKTWASQREESNVNEDESVLENSTDPEEEKLMGELYKKVMALRNEIADSKGLAPYMVFSNKNLLDISVHRPTSVQSMTQIEGITTVRVSKFGEPMIKLVSAFCKENGLKEDVFSSSKLPTQTNTTNNHLLNQLNATTRETYRLYETLGQDVDRVARDRNLSSNTVINHLCDAIKVGLTIPLSTLGVTDEIFEIISKIIRSPPINSDVSRLTPIKQLCPAHIEFNHIKIVIAALQSKYGLNDTPEEKGNSSVSTSENQSNGSPPKCSIDESTKQPAVIPTENVNKRKEGSHFVSPTEAPSLKKVKSSKLFKL